MRRVSFGTSKHVSQRPLSAIPCTTNRRAIRNDAIATASTTRHSYIRAHVRNPCRFTAPTGKRRSTSVCAARQRRSSSSTQQSIAFQRLSQPMTRSSSVHDLDRHKVFRATELDFGPIIGQGFYGIARTVRSTREVRRVRKTFPFPLRSPSGKQVR